MSHDPVTLGPDATLAEAAACMAERRIGCLAIVDETGRLAGLLSETDVLWAVANAARAKAARRRRPTRCARLAGARALPRTRARAQAPRAGTSPSEQSLEAADARGADRQAERGADVTLVQESIALDELALRRLAAIDEALDRAAQGQLGNCARCGNVIPIPRLRALPAATLCIACARSEPGASRRSRRAGPASGATRAARRAPRRRAPRRGPARAIARARAARRRRARPRPRRGALAQLLAPLAHAARSARAAARAGPSSPRRSRGRRACARSKSAARSSRSRRATRAGRAPWLVILRLLDRRRVGDDPHHRLLDLAPRARTSRIVLP